MLNMIKNLIAHKGHANAVLIKAIEQHVAAAQDQELHKLLHHILVANRFWLLTCMDRPFVLEIETQIPASLNELAELYRETHDEEWQWLSQLPERELARRLENPLIPGGSCSVMDALMQVCLHSHGHRAQAATRLRALGGTPPPLDFILWLQNKENHEEHEEHEV